MAPKFLSIWVLFFNIDMKDVLLQKKFISWTALFHSIVGIGAPDKSAFLVWCLSSDLPGGNTVWQWEASLKALIRH